MDSQGALSSKRSHSQGPLCGHSVVFMDEFGVLGRGLSRYGAGVLIKIFANLRSSTPKFVSYPLPRTSRVPVQLPRLPQRGGPKVA